MDPSRPSNQSSNGASAASPKATRLAPAQPASIQHVPASAPRPAAAELPSAVKPAGQGTPPAQLTIVPQPGPGGSPAIEFDWEPVMLGSNRSFSCMVTSDGGEPIVATLEQGIYRRSLDGPGVVKVPAIPPAPAGTIGSLTVRVVTTGASVTYTWRWQPREAGSPSPQPPARPAGFLSRLIGRAKPTAVPPAQARTTLRVATVAERLGSRAAMAVPLRFFGQEAVGQRFAFILDRSGSMSGRRWDACTKQLENAMRAMPEHVECFLVLFASRDLEPPGQVGWTTAGRAYVDSTMAWVHSIQPGGGTAPASAFKRVFSLPTPPDVIYFLTDGELDGFGAFACASLRGANPSVINTIALENGASANELREMATASGGQFIHVSDLSAGKPGV